MCLLVSMYSKENNEVVYNIVTEREALGRMLAYCYLKNNERHQRGLDPIIFTKDQMIEEYEIINWTWRCYMYGDFSE